VALNQPRSLSPALILLSALFDVASVELGQAVPAALSLPLCRGIPPLRQRHAELEREPSRIVDADAVVVRD
jgi:hypothetical protein